MKAPRFDHFTRRFGRGTTRRRLLAGLALSPFVGLVAAQRLDDVMAKNKRHHKKRKQKAATPNSFGCIDVGDLCQKADQCCSGVCDGKKGRKTCRAHDSGSCRAGALSEACGGTDVACTTSSGLPGLCGTTTGNAGYCWATGGCIACQTDADCQAVAGGVLGSNAACIQCAECAETTGGTACATPIIPDGNPERRIG